MAAEFDYEVPTWSQICDLLLCQAQKIQRSPYKPDVVVGIAKGGLIPARILTDLLETPQLAVIQIEFYTGIGQTTFEPALKQPLTTSAAGKKVLLVDDIADSGKSLKLAKTHLNEQGAGETKTAVLYRKPQSAETPDFCEKQTDRWVVFPWETRETLHKILQRQQGKRSLNQEIAKLVRAGLPKQLAEKLLNDMV